MIDKSVDDLSVILNTKYSIKSRDGKFRNFKGLIEGTSQDMYEWNGMRCTGEHQVGLDGVAVNTFKDAKQIQGSELVYDMLDVEETNDWIAKGPGLKSKEVLNKNCQTGEQLVNIRDSVLNRDITVSFEQLKQMIIMDNLGLDYNETSFVEL